MEIKQKKDYILRKVMNDYMLFPTGENTKNFKGTILLNELAAFIWKQMKEYTNETKILKNILKEYDVSEEQARQDIKQLITVFIEKGIIEVKKTGI